ncbi:MAG: hypothetical protein HY075_06360 [Deltaproteobacteria bacterium]|nr:hypothetical protein [Deltaproteobacteria bacterium]
MSKLDLAKIETYSLLGRSSKVEVSDFAKPLDAATSKAFHKFYESLPSILAADDLRDLVVELKAAKKSGKKIMWGMGSHVLKTGLAPILIDLMDEGFITSIAFNGSALIHDFETAFAGKTSEDVDAVLGGGQFGMAKETGDLVNEAINKGVAKGMGLGEALGAHIAASDYEYKNLSLFAQAYERKLPATVHVAIGTDIIHMHPKCDPAALGLGSHRDFMRFAEEVAGLEGGAYVNFGSAVILPEVFLKSITLVRNLKFKVDKICTANFDFIQAYRSRVNVVQRPTTNGGRGFTFTGHHELMLPILAAALKS